MAQARVSVVKFMLVFSRLSIKIFFSPRFSQSDIDDSPGFLERAEFLLKDWVTIALSPNTCRDPLKGFSVFVGKMNAHGILKGDEPLTRFFRFATQYCIDLTYRNMNEPNAKTKIFQFIDAYVRLIALLVKHSGESGSTNTKLNLLNKVLRDHNCAALMFKFIIF